MPEDESSGSLEPTEEMSGVRPGAPRSALDSDSQHGRFLPGTLFGKRYRIVGLLGTGGMGEVYRADDLQLGQSVALKFLPPHLGRNEAALARLRSEVRIARQVSHPNVCRVYDIGEAEEQYFLSMEYVDGEDLGSVLRRMGRPSQEKALQIARQLCAGLAAAHENGVLHRDLKPANIMIDGRGRVRITDFGLAGLAEEFAGPHPRGGTPAYMAPEQLAGQELSVQSDVYSLGLVLYELLTARRAFEASSPAELKKLHDSGAPSTPASVVPDVDPAVERVVLRCLAKDPSKRPSSALAVAAALPGGDPLAAALAAGETPSPEMVAAAGGRGGLPMAAAAACLAAVLAGLIAVALLNDRVGLWRLSPIGNPPAVLAHRAGEILRGLGQSDPPADTSHAFCVNTSYLAGIEENDRSPARWGRLRGGRPAAFHFQYRHSPRPLIPQNTLARVDWTDPPPVVSGMAGVVLDSAGRLLMLEIVPPEKDDSPQREGPTDFSALFAAAQLDPGSLRKAEPIWNPLSACDERAAWVGPYPGHPDWTIRLEAGAYRGRPVYFRVVDPFSKTWRTPQPQGATTIGRGVEMIGVPLAVILLVAAALIARYNLRMGRGDRRGALRLGTFTFLLGMLAWALSAHHVGGLAAELGMLLRGLGLALVLGLWCGLAYLALEPYARGRWPNVLISWTRLLTGRFRNPLVGRAILVGGVAGAAWALVAQLALVAGAWFGLPTGRPRSPQLRVFQSGREALGEFLACDFLLNSLYCLFLLLGLLFLLRKRWVAVAAAWGLLAVLVSAESIARLPDPVAVAELVRVGVSVALVYFVLVRFGLLALVLAWFFHDRLLRFAITLDTSAWYAERSLLVLGALVVVAVWGFRLSTARRSPAGRRLPET